MAEFPESHRDLLYIPVGVLATHGRSGYPQVTALWFVFDSGSVRISLNTTRRKLKNLRRDPKCTLFLLDPANPYRNMEVRAVAEIDSETANETVELVEQKYGADVRRNDRPGESRVTVTLRPVRVRTWG